MKKRRRRWKSLRGSREKIKIDFHFYSHRLHGFSQIVFATNSRIFTIKIILNIIQGK
jgi:hypothetical protein